MWTNWTNSGLFTMLLVLGSLNEATSLAIAYRGSSKVIRESSSRLERFDKPNRVTDLHVEAIGEPLNVIEWTTGNETLPVIVVQLNWTAAGHRKHGAKMAKFVEIRASLDAEAMLLDFKNGVLIDGVRTRTVPMGQEQKAQFKLPFDLVNSTAFQDVVENSTDIFFALVTINENNYNAAAEMSNLAVGRFKPFRKIRDKIRGEFIMIVSGILVLLGALMIVALTVCNLVMICKKTKHVYEIDKTCKVFVISGG